jgi:hypothetical protein
VKRFFLGVAVGVALSIGALYSVQAYYLGKFRLQMALQKRGEDDFRRAFPDARGSASVLVDGKPGDARLSAGRDGKYVVHIEYLRDCVFKDIRVPYQVKQGKVQPQTEDVFQRLDAEAKPVSRKGCAPGTVTSQ